MKKSSDQNLVSFQSNSYGSKPAGGMINKLGTSPST
jgi:hypothetical protein